MDGQSIDRNRSYRLGPDPGLPLARAAEGAEEAVCERVDRQATEPKLADGDAIKFDVAPTSPNSAFIMADGGGDNAAGELAFGGFVVKNQGKVDVFAINCSHLGCSIALNAGAKSFDCPCHGSRFHLDGTVLHGPAAYPLSHLTWTQAADPTTIDVDGIVLGF